MYFQWNVVNEAAHQDPEAVLKVGQKPKLVLGICSNRKKWRQEPFVDSNGRGKGRLTVCFHEAIADNLKVKALLLQLVDQRQRAGERVGLCCPEDHLCRLDDGCVAGSVELASDARVRCANHLELELSRDVLQGRVGTCTSQGREDGRGKSQGADRRTKATTPEMMLSCCQLSGWAEKKASQAAQRIGAVAYLCRKGVLGARSPCGKLGHVLVEVVDVLLDLVKGRLHAAGARKRRV